MSPPKVPIEERFWERVDKSGDCWEWTKARHSTGYGWLAWRGGQVKAHRLAYELAKGPIPEGPGYHGTVIMHTCDNRLCCNPAHLVAATHQANMADMKQKGRRKNINAGSKNGRAKINDLQAAQIRLDSRPTAQIALEYGVSRSTVNRIKSGQCHAA